MRREATNEHVVLPRDMLRRAPDLPAMNAAYMRTYERRFRTVAREGE
jgi:hypothetical protein